MGVGSLGRWVVRGGEQWSDDPQTLCTASQWRLGHAVLLGSPYGTVRFWALGPARRWVGVGRWVAAGSPPGPPFFFFFPFLPPSSLSPLLLLSFPLLFPSPPPSPPLAGGLRPLGPPTPPTAHPKSRRQHRYRNSVKGGAKSPRSGGNFFFWALGRRNRALGPENRALGAGSGYWALGRALGGGSEVRCAGGAVAARGRSIATR